MARTTTVTSSLSGTVIKAADAVGTTFDTITAGVETLNRFVQKHATIQQAQIEMELDKFFHFAEQEHLIEIAEKEAELIEKIQQNPKLEPLLKKNEDHVTKLFDRILNRS